MRGHFLLCALILATVVGRPQAKPQWQVLFDGTSLDAFRGYKSDTMPAGWSIVNGTMAKDAPTTDIVTKEQFGDFELVVEWKIAEAGNAGIFYRGTEEYDRVYWSAPEYQLLDDEKARRQQDPAHVRRRRLRALSLALWTSEEGRQVEHDPDHRAGSARRALAERREARGVRAVEPRLGREGRGQQVRQVAELRPRQARPHRDPGRPRRRAGVPQDPHSRGEMTMATRRPRSRRQFLSTVGLATAGFTIVPRHVLGRGFQAPSDRLNIAAVGVGGRGRQVITNMASQNLVAMCDVDWGYADQGFAGLTTEIATLEKRIAANAVEVRVPASARNEGAPPTITTRPMTPLERSRAIATVERQQTLAAAVPKATRHQDFRRMLDQQKDIDAVVVATPDHLHAGIALAAMDLGKHVYVEKPLCWSVAEARQLARRAADTKVATQMGNQGHSLDDGRTAVEYLRSGAIGEVRDVHVWTNRPLGFWPQGVPRPAPLTTPAESLRWNGPGINARVGAALMGHYPVPEGLAWDLFLGPAPQVDYHPVYHPFNWRGWVDWGSGPLGDMGAHLIDHAYWALDLGLPTTVETVSTPFNGVCFPHATTTYYEFAARGRQPAVKMTWYDGGLLPPKPVEMGEEALNPGGGTLVVGTKGKLLYETYGAKPRLLPKSLHESVGTPARTLTRIPDELHEMNFVEAAKGQCPRRVRSSTPPSSPR